MFHKKEKNGFQYFISDIFGDESFVHAFSSRVGKNDNDFALLNKNNCKDEKICENRKLFCNSLDINEKNLVMPEQTHSSNIKIISSGNIEDLSNTDGIIVTKEGIAGMLFFADCTPLILYSKKDRIFALLHAGWKGSAANIAGKAVEIMHQKLGVEPENIKAAIGACISKCCFEINEDVAQKLTLSLKNRHNNAIEERGGKIFADLKKINSSQLIEQGIKDIDIMEYCSVCQNDLFFSYRKENSTAKRHAITAQMKKR